MRIIFGFCIALFASLAFAEPVTYSSITPPTFSQPSEGTPDGYRLYQGCDIGAQTKGALIDGAYTSGKAYSFAGDSDSPPTLCVVAWTQACADETQGPCATNDSGEGGFDSAWTLTASTVVEPPGSVIINTSEDCSAVGQSATVFNCNVTIIVN